MRVSRASLVLLVLAIPASLHAQRRGGSYGGRGDRGPAGGGAMAPAMPSSKNILKESPLRLLLDKQKDLSLTDSQKVTLLARQTELDQALAPALAQLDSSTRDARAERDFRAASDEDRMRMMARMTSIRAIMDNVRAREDSASALAVADLTEQQQPRAKELLEKRREGIRKRESRPSQSPRRPPRT